MLSKKTCERIYHCHREIEAGENLLEKIKEEVDRCEEGSGIRDKLEPALSDVFGKKHRTLELGVPNGEHSKRLFQLSYELSIPVIKAHIENKRSELAELNQIAYLESQGNK